VVTIYSGKDITMGSNVKQTRIQQKEKLLRQLNQRKAILVGKGADGDTLKKDNIIKHLLADLKRASRAIASIEAREKVITVARQQKLEKAQKSAAEAAEPKKKKGKAQAAPPKEGKKEKKQKKEKQEPAE
jgi:hypothetical protein